LGEVVARYVGGKAKTDPRLEFEALWEEYASGRDNYTWLGRLSLEMERKIVFEILDQIKVSCVLDVGCGVGRTPAWFRQEGVQFVHGIDTSPSAVLRCKTRGHSAIPMDCSRTGFRDDYFDLVFAEGLLEHFTDFAPLVKEMCRTG
jgi:SAM-dependent methyltransferase